ncbi:hypothetical protein [Streptodolium elevatio]|uniref:Tetratricopeptide repeat protein n=1 Tax=Streptodolium elevatio TaxID=3157996 RepID=A0ABV3DU36_9ACTN
MTISDLDKAWELVEGGDVSAVMRHLRGTAGRLEIRDLALVVEKAAGMVGFDDLVEASRALAAKPRSADKLFEFGYACIEHGAAYAAIPALVESLRRSPKSRGVFLELASAYEREERHGEAVALLESRDATLRDWPDRYLLVYNAVLAGDLTRARTQFVRLPAPADEDWEWAYGRLGAMLSRADAAAAVAPLDHEDLRGWQFVLTGGVLATISPYGFRTSMVGRHAFHQDSPGSCRQGLDRLAAVLGATGAAPASVSLLDDRGSRILGLAAADVLGLPAVPYEPGRPDTVVVAYRLDDVAEGVVESLHERAPGQVLFEHATCWTSPPPVAADISVLLRQAGNAPWEKRLTADPEGGAPDGRPEAEIAADVVAAQPDADHPGDEDAPPDTGAELVAFAAGVASAWAARTSRDQCPSTGPVRSARFR